MNLPSHFRWALGILLGLLAAAGFLWLAQNAVRLAGEFDQNPRGPNLKSQMMRRKSNALDDIMRGMVRGNLARVDAGARRMQRYGRMVDGFLVTDAYEKHGQEFHQSLRDLRAAAGEGNRNEAKEATLRLERSCIECHFLFIPGEPSIAEPVTDDGDEDLDLPASPAGDSPEGN